MKVNLKQVPIDGTPFVVEAQLDLSQLRQWGEYPVRSPVAVKASFSSKNGAVLMCYTADYVLHSTCGRCLEETVREGGLSMEHELVEQMEDEWQDDYILVPDGELDLDELVMGDISLNLDGVPLCAEDCKGLCPTCGQNRNRNQCGCGSSEPDHRFDVLRRYLADQSS